MTFCRINPIDRVNGRHGVLLPGGPFYAEAYPSAAWQFLLWTGWSFSWSFLQP